MASLAATPGPSITSAFDSGNIEVVSQSGSNFELRIRDDPYTEGTDNKSHKQWFHFRCANVLNAPCIFRIVNAGECSYPSAFVGYRAVCSYDRERWFRVPTSFQDGVLTVSLTPLRSTVWCAYFAPFSYEQHCSLIARCAASPMATVVRSLGQTLDGRELDLVQCGSGDINVWVTARQHPGESMAEFWAEGFLTRLLDGHDALARTLRGLCTFRVVPNMNPDGSVRGHLRTNASGANLNREWAPSKGHPAPTLTASPEVFYVLREMDSTGVDLFIDVHGDEELPHNFFAGSQGTSHWTPRIARLLQTLGEAYNRANPDFGSLLQNYGNDEPGQALLTVATDQVAERFNCLSVTLEQPFKDVFDNPEPALGYSPARARRLGASALDAIAAVAPLLNDENMPSSDPAAWTAPGYKPPKHEECAWQEDGAASAL